MSLFETATDLFSKHGIVNCAVLPGDQLICINPRKWPSFPVKSAILALFPYFSGWNEGNICTYASVRDYHIVCADILQEVSGALKVPYPENRFAHFTDNSPIDEVAAALKGGLGYKGQNNLLISPDFGSLCFIGEILCDVETAPSPPFFPLACAGCQKCIDACPTGALTTGSGGAPLFVKNRCLSFLTQQKGELDPLSKDRLKKGGMIWGCDQCQKVCPHNREANTTLIPAFLEKKLSGLSYEEVSQLTNAEFTEKYRDFAFCYKGRGLLLRNILLTEGEDRAEDEANKTKNG